MPTLQKQLENFLKGKDWQSKGDITRMTWRGWSNGQGKIFLPETVGRALRSLEEDKVIAVKYRGKNTLYKYIPTELRDRYIPSSERTNEKLFR